LAAEIRFSGGLTQTSSLLGSKLVCCASGDVSARWNYAAVDRRQVPSDNVWVPGELHKDTAVGVIASYFQVHADNYKARTMCYRAASGGW
jgi:hypothetical protein